MSAETAIFVWVNWIFLSVNDLMILTVWSEATMLRMENLRQTLYC